MKNCLRFIRLQELTSKTLGHYCYEIFFYFGSIFRAELTAYFSDAGSGEVQVNCVFRIAQLLFLLLKRFYFSLKLAAHLLASRRIILRKRRFKNLPRNNRRVEVQQGRPKLSVCT